jgi:uncharacterized protein (DUF2141 family)
LGPLLKGENVKFIWFVLLILILGVMDLANAQGTLQIGIRDGLEKETGTVFIYLYKSKEEWKVDNGLEIAKVNVAGLRQGVTVSNLSPGLYAVSAFLDEDKNGELTATTIKISGEKFSKPHEKVALSRIDGDLWATPDWEELNFEVKEGESKRIELHFQNQ